MEGAQPASTPPDPHAKLEGAETETALDDKGAKLYQTIASSLMYATLATRPDIAFTVAALYRWGGGLRTGHLAAARRIVCCLRTGAVAGYVAARV